MEEITTVLWWWRLVGLITLGMEDLLGEELFVVSGQWTESAMTTLLGAILLLEGVVGDALLPLQTTLRETLDPCGRTMVVLLRRFPAWGIVFGVVLRPGEQLEDGGDFVRTCAVTTMEMSDAGVAKGLWLLAFRRMCGLIVVCLLL